MSNTTVGRSTWDSLHGAPGARPFHSIFQVRFVMTHESVLASAGTTSFLEDAPQNFDSIEKIRISARVKNQGADPTAHREVNWESAEVMFQYNNSVPNENREFYYLTALPRATSPQKRKLSSLADKNLQVGDHFEQYLELSAAGDPKFIGLELVALASFRANDPAFPQSAFGPDDLQLRIAVWAPIP